MKSQTVMKIGGVEITERDRRLIYDTYRLRILPREYIQEIHFGGKNTTWIHERLTKLTDAGLVVSKARFWGREKQTTVTMAENGMALLREWGFVVGDDVDTRYLNEFSSKHRIQSLCALRKFYVPFAKEGWIFDDSRQYKRRRYLPNHARMMGCLTPPGGEHEYAVYLLDETSRERQLVGIMNEVRELKLPRVIVLYRSSSREHYQRMEFVFERASRERMVAAHFHLLPFAPASAEILKRVLPSSSIVKYFTRKYDAVNPVTNKYGLEPFEIVDGGERYYVLEYLSHDLSRLEAIKNYTDIGFMEQKQKLRIFTWEFFKEEIYRHVTGAKHIEIEILDPKELNEIPVVSDPHIDPVMCRAPTNREQTFDETFEALE